MNNVDLQATNNTIRQATLNNYHLVETQSVNRQSTHPSNTIRQATLNDYRLVENQIHSSYGYSKCSSCVNSVNIVDKKSRISCLRCKRFFCIKCQDNGIKCKKDDIHTNYLRPIHTNYLRPIPSTCCGACRKYNASPCNFDFSKCNVCKYEIKYITVEDKYTCLLENCEITDEQCLKMTQEKFLKLQTNESTGNLTKPAVKHENNQ